MSARRRRAAGLTLIEVLLAMAVVAVALIAWARLEGSMARVRRDQATRRVLASWMRNELRLQRSVRAATCVSQAAPDGWSCSVARRCLDGTVPCELESVTVRIAPPRGRALVGSTAVWWPLERAPVGLGR